METFKINNVEIAPKEDVKAFWKDLRYFYRTGDQPREPKKELLSSPFYKLIDTPSPFPFVLDNEPVEFTPDWYLKVLSHHLESFKKVERAQFERDISRLILGIGKLLGIKEATTGDEKLYGFATEIIAFDKLKEIVPHVSKGALEESRKSRLSSLLSDLKDGLAFYRNKEALVLHDSLSNEDSICKRIQCKKLNESNVFRKGYSLAKENMNRFSNLIRAYRIAKLELDNEFQEDIHSEFFEHFNWYRLLNEEKQLFHPIVMITTTKTTSEYHGPLTNLLSSNFPVSVLVLNNEPISIPKQDLSWEEAAHSTKQELSALALSQRSVYYYQGTIDKPDLFSQAIFEGLAKPSPSVWQLLVANEFNVEDAIKARGAQMSRYFPNLTISPFDHELSNKLIIQHCLHSKLDWPKIKLKTSTDGYDEEFTWDFTYADYKALYQSKVKELMVVPNEYNTDQLVPLSVYLKLNVDQVIGKIPFIWLTDRKNELTRAAVPHQWVVSCLERQGFWRFLNALSDQETESKTESTVDQIASNNENEDTAEIKKDSAEEVVNKLLTELLKDPAQS